MSEAKADAAAAQKAIPLAVLRGKPVVELPEGLYIPPEALEVFLDAFEGPLDLLLYLIRRKNLDLEILDLPLADITEQYLQYIFLMKELKLDIASEYLVMAATLAEIKSRELLPAPEEEGEDEGDSKAELLRLLQDYERFKTAADNLGQLPRLERDVFAFAMDTRELSVPRPLPKVGLQDLLMALESMLLRVQYNIAHEIEAELLSVQDRMSEVMARVDAGEACLFTSLFRPEEGRQGLAVTLLAVLELLRLNMIDCRQEEFGGPIEVFQKAAAGEQAGHA